MSKADEEKADKEMWRLRWEYLKRSDNYKHYCAMVNDPDFIPDDDLLWSCLRANYRIFGDIYKDKFKDWWKTERRYAVKDEYLSHLRINGEDVVDYSSLIVDDMNNFRDRFNALPSLDEFIQAFSDHLKNVRWLFLRVNILGVNESDIIKQIRYVIKKKEKQLSMKLHKDAISLYDGSQGRRDQLRTYLKVYDLQRCGETIKQIIERLGSAAEKSKIKDNDVKRNFLRYSSKAKNIIQNVERLDFPGKY